MIEFDWLIHYKCNYRCSYCFFEGWWDEVEERNNYIRPDKWIKAWKSIYQKYGEFKLIITGGEPFIYPDFINLLDKLNKYAEIAFDTNFSCSWRVLEQLADKINPDRVFMGLSFHPMFANLDLFLKKAAFLRKKGFNFRVHYVTYPLQLDNLRKYKDIFVKEGFRFTPIPFRGEYRGKTYPEGFTNREKEIIYKVTAEIEEIDTSWANKQVKQIRSKNELCYAGQYYARVDSNGTVYLCGNDYTKSRKKYSLGNLFKADFQLNDKPIVCRQETCPCEFRWLVDKETAGYG